MVAIITVLELQEDKYQPLSHTSEIYAVGLHLSLRRYW